MTELKTSTSRSWSPQQALTLALFSLLLGVSGGWLIRRSIAAVVPRATDVVSTPDARVPAGQLVSSQPASASPSAQQLKLAADNQAASLVDELKRDPMDAGLLTKLGNLYYDAEQYRTAIEYYERSLKLQPADTSVRTDLATAYWYTGATDAAIAEFQKTLTYDPTKANALFNLGIVKWKGKRDTAGAIADWQKLLAANPRFEERAKVEGLIAEAKTSLEQQH